ncbi:MAG TPA: hypothetical protein PKD75_02300, partial [Tepidiformaceae bacterium]|nr:hypothetical protein [Tepidiformaceae bacterium]
EGTIANYFDEATDIHHIFPKAWCQQHGIPAARYDSIINKTPLSAHTNRVIGGRAPSDYLKRVASGAGISDTQLDRYLATHLIEPATLRADVFQAFFEQRAQGLLAHIERAMGKAAAAEAAPEEPDERLTYDDLGTEDLEPEDDAA